MNYPEKVHTLLEANLINTSSIHKPSDLIVYLDDHIRVLMKAINAYRDKICYYDQDFEILYHELQHQLDNKKNNLTKEDVKMEEEEDVGHYDGYEWPDENEDDDEEMKVNDQNDLNTYIPHTIDEIE